MSVLSKFLGILSGGNTLKVSEQLLFDKVIGFKGVVPGVGTSTIVQNVAIAISENTNSTVCVLDMNCLYPTQYAMLVKTDDILYSKEVKKDIYEFTGDVSDIVRSTMYRNVYTVGFSDRTIVDMLSAKDDSNAFNQLLGALKSFFDIILVDLSYELTSMNTQAAVKCNKIFYVADQSLKCSVNIQKSLNTAATLAVPLAKANNVILNKVVPDLKTDTLGLLHSLDLNVVGQIHYSLDLLKAGVYGKGIYTKSKTNNGYEEFNGVVDDIIGLILNKTPLTKELFSPNNESNINNDDINTKIKEDDTKYTDEDELYNESVSLNKDVDIDDEDIEL